MGKEMTGTCAFCGQTRLVIAEDQSEANRVAAEECTCDNNLKKVRQCADNIDLICGKSATEYGMEIVTEEVVDALKSNRKNAGRIKMSDSIIFILGFLCGIAVMVFAVVMAAMTPDDLRELTEEKRDRKRHRRMK